MTWALTHARALLVALAAILLLGGAWYVRGVLADRAELRQSVATLQGTVVNLGEQLVRERGAVLAAQEAARQARTEAGTARRGLENARRNDPAVSDWADAPLPDGVRRALEGAR